MTDLVERLRETFQRRRYGGGAEYDPDLHLLDAAADEIERLRGENKWLCTDFEAQRTEIDRLKTEIEHLKTEAYPR